MGNRQNLPHSQLTETKPKQQNQPPSEKVISHFYRKKFARPFGVNGRTENDLVQYLAAVEADYLDFDDPYRGISHGCGIGWKEPGYGTLGGGAQCRLGFRKTVSQSHPLRLYFGFDWGLNRPQKNRSTYRPDPVPPPPGYEHVDMTAPKNFGPDSMVEILRSKGVDIGDGKGGIPQDKYFSGLSEATPRLDGKMNPESSKGKQPKQIRGWWIVASVLALLVLFALICRNCRSHAGG